MSDCECGWEGHRLHSNTLRAGKVDGDFLVLPAGRHARGTGASTRGRILVTHEAFQSWLEDPLGFIPKNQATLDQEKRERELVGFKDGIVPTGLKATEVDDDSA